MGNLTGSGSIDTWTGPNQFAVGDYLVTLTVQSGNTIPMHVSVSIYHGTAAVGTGTLVGSAGESGPLPASIVGSLPQGSGGNFNFYAPGAYRIALSVSVLVHSESIFPDEISGNAQALANLSGIPADFIQRNAAQVASELMASGVKDSDLLNVTTKFVTTLGSILPPTAATVRSQLAAPLALALGIPSDVINAVADQVAAKFISATPYIRASDFATPAGIQAAMDAVHSLPAPLRPPPGSATREAGCSALGYAWSTSLGRCFQSDADRMAAENPQATSGVPETTTVASIIAANAGQIAESTGSSAVSIQAQAGAIAAEIQRQGLTAEQITTDPVAGQRAAAIAAQVSQTPPASPLLIVGGLVAAGAVGFILLRRRR